jgi:Spx/MgsR family transcriptional regulator
MWVVYGIKNCDQVKKTCSLLKANQISYRLHDYRVDGLEAALLQRFIESLGLENVLNQRSSSWRQLSTEQKQTLDPENVLQLLLSTPTLIKRPILDTGKQLIVGVPSADSI